MPAREAHGLWKGDRAAPHTGRERARRWFPALDTCAECEVATATERHHWDGNPLNNERNVVPVCNRCHSRLHGLAPNHISFLRRTLTHCVQGHPLDATNAYLDPRGWRVCRICRRERRRAHARRS